MNDRPRPSDPRKLQQHNAGVFESVQSQEVAYVLNKIKRTVVKQHPPQSNHRPAEQLPERQREIRMAIEMRYVRSKMNKDYVYHCEDDTPGSNRESTHSSDMEEYQHLKDARFVNLNDQNRRPKRQHMEKYESLRGVLKKFKIGSNQNSSVVRRTEGDESDHKRILSNQKTLSKDDSPVNFGSKYMFKSSKANKKGDKRKVNLSEESAKYRTLGAPYLQKSREFVRYAHHKAAKSKEQLSRDSSSSEKSHLLQSNLTLQVDFKKKLNGNSSMMHYKNVSSSTRLGSVPKAPPQEKSRGKVVSTSSGKLQKNDRLMRLLFNGKKL